MPDKIGLGNLTTPLQGILLFLSILAIVVPATLGFVNLDKRIDVVEGRVETHITTDAGKWEYVYVKIDETKDDVQVLQISDGRQSEQYNSIMRMLGEMNAKLDTTLTTK